MKCSIQEELIINKCVLLRFRFQTYSCFNYIIRRGYYMAARGIRILSSSAESISHEWAKRASERYWWNSYIKHNLKLICGEESVDTKSYPVCELSLYQQTNEKIKMFSLFHRVRRSSVCRENFENSIKNGKHSCNWLIMLVTTATPISSHVKDKNSIFTARDEDMIF